MEPRQARAEITRRKIIDAAIDLFAKTGYGETGLAEIIKAAEVTKGSFYYYFPAKEALAAAIIQEAEAKIIDLADQATSTSSPALESVITMTFAIARAGQTDPCVRIGEQLARSLSQVSSAGGRTFQRWTAYFVAEVEKASTQGDIREDIAPADAAEAIWSTVIGTHLLSNALDDDTNARLAKAWQVLLRGIVPAESMGYFQEFVKRASLRAAPAP